MPIRHCQKCGLKVLIDEGQSAQSPFYCQRCAATLRTAQTAPPKAPEPQKTGPVKLICPNCNGTFNGRLPARPARGSCPVCRKDLVLLPTGEIKRSGEFDPQHWKAEQEHGVGTREEEPSEPMTAPTVPKPTSDPSDSYEPTTVQVPASDPTPPPRPAAEPARPRPMPTRGQRVARRPPPIEETLLPPPSQPAKQGAGKLVFALLLFFIPLVGAGAVGALRERPRVEKILDRFGEYGKKGLGKLHAKIEQRASESP